MASKDISLGLVEHLELLKQNKSDYLLIVLEPGKNADRADVWYELRDKHSPANLIEACLNLFSNIYEKEELIETLLGFSEYLNDISEEEYLENREANMPLPETKKKKKKKNPPNDNEETGDM